MEMKKLLPEKRLSRLSTALLIVCLIVSGMFTVKHSFALSVPASPTSAFCKAAFTPGVNGLQVNCTDLSFTMDTIISWSWTFGDGGTSTLQNPSHTYSSAGTYNICLAIQSSSGCQDTACFTVLVVSPPSACKAGFIASVGSLNTTFTDLSLASGTITSWSWTFGDGGTSSLQNPSHQYASKGTYNVCLAIQSSSGCSDTLCRPVYVDTITSVTIPSLTNHCKAAFTYFSTNGFTDLSMSFTDVSFTFNSIVNWNWNFGDGGTSTLQNPVHVYSSAGTYNVCLATEDSGGCKDTMCLNVYVSVIKVPTPPTPPTLNSCAAAFITHANGLQADFTDLSFALGTITNWDWTFGDGGTSTLQNPTHTYSTKGLYTVCLAIQSTGCNDTLCYSIYVDSGLVYMKKQLPPVASSSASSSNRLSEVTLKAYPNPASESTAITYSLPADGFAKVVVLDLLGNEIEVLSSADSSKGEHSVIWSTTNVPDGIYLVRIMANDNVVTKKLIVVK